MEADVREELPLRGTFDSVAMNFVLHCLPSPQDSKGGALRNAAAVLAPDGVLFGATILGERRLHNGISRSALRYLNRQGVFDNHDDTETGLRSSLAAAFDDVAIEIVGTAAVFTARSPRHPA